MQRIRITNKCSADEIPGERRVPRRPEASRALMEFVTAAGNFYRKREVLGSGGGGGGGTPHNPEERDLGAVGTRPPTQESRSEGGAWTLPAGPRRGRERGRGQIWAAGPGRGREGAGEGLMGAAGDPSLT